jgi:hypothetical protein
MMRNGKEVMLQLLCLAMTCSLIGLSGCRKASDVLEGEPLSEVLLRYTPQVGQTRDYRVSMNLHKKIFLKGLWRNECNERGKVTFSLTTVEQTAAGYRTTFDGQWGDSSFSAETKDVMNDKVEAVRGLAVIVSDRYVWDKGGTHNLCFPDEPVSPGDQWEGAVLFTFGDMVTVDEPTLPVAYRLVNAVENEAGRYAVIECSPLTDKVEVPLQFGQLGLKCDATGTVTAVREDCDAQDKINVGDELLAVNGHPAATAKDWHTLYERFIEMPNNVGEPVVLTVRREGQEQEIEVLKSFATVGTMEVTLSEATRTVVFDIDRGVIVSDRDSPVYSVMYRFLDEFPFVDNYMGTGSFENRAGTEMGPRVYHNQHKMTLLQ